MEKNEHCGHFGEFAMGKLSNVINLPGQNEQFGQIAQGFLYFLGIANLNI